MDFYKIGLVALRLFGAVLFVSGAVWALYGSIMGIIALRVPTQYGFFASRGWDAMIYGMVNVIIGGALILLAPRLAGRAARD